MPGAMLFSNVNGVALADARFEPLYAEANRARRDPAHPSDGSRRRRGDDRLLAHAARRIPVRHDARRGASSSSPACRSGIPNIKWVLGHLGGAIPYLAERLDRGFEAFPDCRADISRRRASISRRFYYDTVNFDPDALVRSRSISPAPITSWPAATIRIRSAASHQC